MLSDRGILHAGTESAIIVLTRAADSEAFHWSTAALHNNQGATGMNHLITKYFHLRDRERQRQRQRERERDGETETGRDRERERQRERETQRQRERERESERQ